MLCFFFQLSSDRTPTPSAFQQDAPANPSSPRSNSNRFRLPTSPKSPPLAGEVLRLIDTDAIADKRRRIVQARRQRPEDSATGEAVTNPGGAASTAYPLSDTSAIVHRAGATIFVGGRARGRGQRGRGGRGQDPSRTSTARDRSSASASPSFGHVSPTNPSKLVSHNLNGARAPALGVHDDDQCESAPRGDAGKSVVEPIVLKAPTSALVDARRCSTALRKRVALEDDDDYAASEDSVGQHRTTQSLLVQKTSVDAGHLDDKANANTATPENHAGIEDTRSIPTQGVSVTACELSPRGPPSQQLDVISIIDDDALADQTTIAGKGREPTSDRKHEMGPKTSDNKAKAEIPGKEHRKRELSDHDSDDDMVLVPLHHAFFLLTHPIVRPTDVDTVGPTQQRACLFGAIASRAPACPHVVPTRRIAPHSPTRAPAIAPPHSAISNSASLQFWPFNYLPFRGLFACRFSPGISNLRSSVECFRTHGVVRCVVATSVRDARFRSSGTISNLPTRLEAHTRHHGRNDRRGHCRSEGRGQPDSP